MKKFKVSRIVQGIREGIRDRTTSGKPVPLDRDKIIADLTALDKATSAKCDPDTDDWANVGDSMWHVYEPIASSHGIDEDGLLDIDEQCMADVSDQSDGTTNWAEFLDAIKATDEEALTIYKGYQKVVADLGLE